MLFEGVLQSAHRSGELNAAAADADTDDVAVARKWQSLSAVAAVAAELLSWTSCGFAAVSSQAETKERDQEE